MGTAPTDVQPVIVIDSREQVPLLFTRLESIRKTLKTGDYSVEGLENLFVVERKSIGDLAACVAGNRERFEDQLLRLRGYPFRRLLIVGQREEIENGVPFSKVTPTSIFGTLNMIEVRYCPVVFQETPEAAAHAVETWATYFCREWIQNAKVLQRKARVLF